MHSLPKTLHSLINFAFAHKIFLFSRKSNSVFAHKTFAFSQQRFALPKKLCICSQDLSVLSQKYCMSTENFNSFAFACKSFVYPENFAFVYKMFVFFHQSFRSSYKRFVHAQNFCIVLEKKNYILSESLSSLKVFPFTESYIFFFSHLMLFPLLVLHLRTKILQANRKLLQLNLEL